jgi:hypothetical protein
MLYAGPLTGRAAGEGAFGPSVLAGPIANKPFNMISA